MEPLDELASKAARGDREAFAEIYRSLLEPVYRYLFWNTGCADDAEDLAEEVFLKCMVNIGSYNPKRGAFRSWAFRIAHNLLIDHHRRNKKRAEEPLNEEFAKTGASMAESVEAREKAKALHETLAQLSTIQRQVITMKYFAEMSNTEAAGALGKSEGAINAIQHRALRRIGKTLEERGWKS